MGANPMYDDINYRFVVSSVLTRKPGLTVEDLRCWIDERPEKRTLIYQTINDLRELGMIQIKSDRVYPKDYPIAA
jgi:hypothetical protein